MTESGDALPTDDLPNAWGPRLADLASRKQRSRAMGGPEKIDKHHGRGSLTARERIDLLVDPGSFRELGPLVGAHCHHLAPVRLDAVFARTGHIRLR